MTVLARSTNSGRELSIGPVTELADVNPSTPLVGLGPDSPVSFIPMADASESGEWIGRQTRKLHQVQSGYTPFQEGDVLFAKITPCMENGKGCHAHGLLNGVGFGSTEFHVLRAKPTADARFLYHWLQSDMLRLAAEAMMTGSAGQRRVPSEFFGRWLIPLLNLPEQRRIAEILDTADRAIGETGVLISKLQRMKTGLMHDLLTRGLDERGRLRDPDAHSEQFKDSPLGRIPRDWDVTRFERLAQAIDPQPDHRAPAEVPGGEPYIGVGDFNADGSINFANCRRVSLAALRKQQRSFTIETGDILFGKIGTIGQPRALLQGEYALNANTVLVKPKIASSFVYWLLHSALIERQIQQQTHSTSQPAFGIQKIRAMTVPVPDTAEQQRIAEVLDTHSARIRAEEAYRDKLKLQKKGLMNGLLTGRVRVRASQEVGA